MQDMPANVLDVWMSQYKRESWHDNGKTHTQQNWIGVPCFGKTLGAEARRIAFGECVK